MDERRRRLEREAKLGDPLAQAALERDKQRQEQPPCLRKEKPEPHKYRPSTKEEDKEFLERWPGMLRFDVCEVCNGVRRISSLFMPRLGLNAEPQESPFPTSPFKDLKFKTNCKLCLEGIDHECRGGY